MTKTAFINMRVEPAQHALLTKAAHVLNRDRSTFILDVACREARNVLLNQRLFQLSPEDFDAFQATLDAPVNEHPKLRALLAERAPWEK